MPTLRTVGWIGTSNSSRDTWHGPNILSLSFFRKIALAISWLLNRRQIPQCPEEQRLRHPRNWTSTAGDSSGFTSGFLFEQFLRTSELIFLNPSNSAVFSYDSRNMKSITKTTLQLLLQLELPQDGARLPQDRLNASGSRFLRISCLGILQKNTCFFNVLNIFGGSTTVVKHFFRDCSPV